MLLRKIFSVFLSVALMLAFSSTATAGEISLLSGLYRTQSQKVGGSDAGGKSEISLGARYAEPMSDLTQWFADAKLTMRSFDAGEGQKAPSNATGITIGGGIKIFFPEFAQLVLPYTSAFGRYVMDKDGQAGPEAIEEEKSGLQYGVNIGFRFDVERDLFFEIEGNLFTSDLFFTEVRKQGEDKQEITRTEIYAATEGDLNRNAITFAVGMRL